MNEKEKDANKTEENREYFHLIPNSVFYDDNLTDKQKLIFSEIFQLTQKNGYCYASNSYLSRKMKVDRTTIIRAINRLKELGYIDSELTYEDYSYRVRIRKITINGSRANLHPSGASATMQVQECNNDGGTNAMGDSGTNATYNNINMNDINNNDIYSRADEKNDELIDQVVNYLNEKTGKDFKATTKQTVSLIKARAKDGNSFDDFKKVIDTKTNQWLSNPDMNRYLRPQTLFGTKFESYLQEYSPKNSFEQSSDDFDKSVRERLQNGRTF
ncbi:conserved phage C-terminal domain-containing protein [uncultured Anaerococcus sp.]|uniref:conserved phage C-terminal domain-containing protein n=1 Tax=uncultured Anaerococcus sp. TaxID=293428 RepID=UPI0025ECA3CB|nr:conserved phage C-terminal domain-containing protein [uncultured Anaerococcus sp.]